MCVCVICGQTRERHRVFHCSSSDYREYVDGDFCERCAVDYAKNLAARDERERHDRIVNAFEMAAGGSS